MESRATLNKACFPCFKRKIKCDASVAGLPCQRCVEKGQSSSCIRYSRRPRPSRMGRSSLSARDGRQVAAGNLYGSASNGRSNQVNHLPPSNGDSCVVQQSASSTPSRLLDETAPGFAVDRAADATAHEGETRVKICKEIAMGSRLPPPAKLLDSVGPGKESVEYHNSRNFVTILGELLAHNKARRLTRIVVYDNAVSSDHRVIHPSLSGHDDVTMQHCQGLGSAELEFLNKKQAFSLPAEPHCMEMLKCFFKLCHTYCPVIDRVEILESYQCRRYSPFLMQAILANAAQYAPKALLADCGFADRLEAQKSFFSKATLLYDLGCERSQLRMLQGSLLLGASVWSHALDKDFRYWLQNAARIAIKMGLHKRDIADDLDFTVYKLCKRIWWILYIYDVFMSVIGWRNMRMLDGSDCDVDPLTKDDFDECPIPEKFSHILNPVTEEQKLFLLEYLQLAKISDRCLLNLRTQPELSSQVSGDSLAQLFALWRTSLPDILQVKQYTCMLQNHVLPILLIASSYRIECVVYRTIRNRCQADDQNQYLWAKQRLQIAMLELDTMIGRVIACDFNRPLPLGFVSCAFSSLALRIESALSPSESDSSKILAHTYIYQSMEFLKLMQDLPSVKETISLFEWVLEQRGLTSVLTESGPTSSSKNPQTSRSPGHWAGGERDSSELDSAYSTPFLEETGGTAEVWFKELLDYNIIDDLGDSNGWSI